MKSENSVQVVDEHRFPFSLVSEHKHGQSKILTQQGDVTEHMDKAIGRSVFRIRGAVSANNYVEFEHLSLVGPIVYIQMCLQNPVIATFHLEVVTSANVSLRLSVSTLYDGDAPKFLGRSLRLPLPHISGWIVIKLDLNDILARYCSSGSKTPVTLQSIKKIQMCSSMLFRDIVTSDKHIPFEARLLPKELGIKPQSGHDAELQWVDMVEHCSNLQNNAAAAAAAANLKSPESIAKVVKTSRVQKTLLTTQESPPPAVTIAFGHKIGTEKEAPELKSMKPVGLAIKTNFTESAPAVTVDNTSTALFTMEDLNDSVLAHSPTRQFLNTAETKAANKKGKSETAMMARKAKKAGTDSTAGESSGAAVGSAHSPSKRGSSHHHLIGSPSAADKETVLSQAQSTPRHTLKASNFSTPAAAGAGGVGTGTLGSAGIVRYNVPDVAPSDRLLSLERLLGYNGGPSVLLYEGRMLLLATHSLLVMVDLQSDTSLTTPTHAGLWKAFRNASPSITALGSTGGFRQAILRGHTAPITMIELSDKENLMATAEAVGAEGGAGLLILWDLIEGKKLATLKPHSDTILSAGFSPDCAMLVTCGTDEQHRYQIIVWDLQTTLAEKSVVVGSQASSASFTIARQISEFPIYRIKFSPFEEYSLVSCGRENIRFWRIRKGHLPGRPVVLNEYSRGYSFTELAFNTEGGATLKDGKKHVVYVASNKGLLLRINCQNNQILAAFQLHPSAILSLCVHSGYAATGGEDCRLRVWPLDFSDFLLEAQHEGPVTSIRVSTDGRKQAIGTSTGTLGVLNVSEHSYNTILRSHIGAITEAVKRGPNWHEFATIGRDFTIRVWDVLTATQIIEFSSDRDEPLCLSYHPTDHFLACGFRSGFVRVFDVTTAGVVFENKSHTSAVTGLTFVTPPPAQGGGGLLMLVSAGCDGNLVVHSEVENYNSVKTVSFSGSVGATDKVHLVLDESQSLLAVATATIASIVVFETKDFTAHVKLLPTIQSPAAAAPASSTAAPVGSVAPPTMTAQAVFSQLLSGSGAGNTAVIGRSGVPSTPTAAGSNGSAGSGDSSDSLSGGVIGLFFVSDESGAHLLITTDKHLISIPMHNKLDGRATSRRVNKRITPWDERSTRRMDFGVPTSVKRDDASGLVFMTVRAPVTAPKKTAKATVAGGLTKTQLNKLAAEANAFVVLEVRVQQGYTDAKVLVSPVQVYQDLPGVVLSVCPYFEFSRVVTVDVNGCIGFWEVKDHNLANVKIPEGNFKSTLLLNTKGSSDINNSVSTPLIKDATAAAVEDSNTEELTRDFALAVKTDPAMWSAVSDSETRKAAAAAVAADDEDDVEPESHSSAVGAVESSASAKESFESLLARAVMYTNMPDIPLHPKSASSAAGGAGSAGKAGGAYFDLMFDDDEDTTAAAAEVGGQLSTAVHDLLLQQYDDSMDEPTPEKPPAPPALTVSEEPVLAVKALHKPKVAGGSLDVARTSSDALFGKKNKSEGGPTSAQAFAEFSLDKVSALTGPSVLSKLLPKFKGESGVAGGLLSSPQYDSMQGAALALRNAVPPCFNSDEGVMVTSDGSSIVVKYLHLSESVLLKFPEYLHQFRHCSVVSTSLSHSGVVLAAVIRVVSNTDHSIAHCVVVWCSAAAGEWKVAGMADLNITEAQQQIDVSALNKVLVSWSDNDSLVIVSTARSNSEVKSFAREQIRITSAPMSAILGGSLKDAIHACSCVVNVPTCYVISHFKIFPSRASTDRHLSLFVTSQHKAFHLLLSNVNSSSMFAEVQWSDDIGNRGPYLSLDILKTHGEHTSTSHTAVRKDSRSPLSRLVVALLDSFGAVKFIEFFRDEPGLTPRSVTVNIPASNISGTLHSMTLIPQASSSNLLVALGGTHSIRVFSVQFKDINAKTLSANMVLNFKVTVDFSPDHFFALPFASSHASVSTSLAAPVPPLLSFSESGHIGLVTGSGKEHHCHTLQSSGPSTSDAVSAASAQSTQPLLSLLTHKGYLSLVHSHSGIKVSAVNKLSGVGRVLAAEPVMNGGHLAVGASSGRVALLDALTMEPVEVWPLQGATAVARNSVASSTASFHKKLPGVSTSTDFDFKFHKNHHAHHGGGSTESEECAVVGLNSLAGGMALTVLQRNNAVSIVQLYPSGKADVATVAPAFEHSGPNVITERLTNHEQEKTVLISCAGDEQMCGVLRVGTNILELHRTDHNEASLSPVAASGGYRKKSYWTNVLNLSLKTVGPEGPGSARDQRAGTFDVNINVVACHVQFSGRELLVYAVGRDQGANHHSSSSSSVYYGSVSMPESASSTFAKDSPTRVMLTKQVSFAESVESFHFHKDVLAVALSTTVLAFELLHPVKDWASNGGSHGVGTVEQKALRQVLNIPASTVALGSNWQQTTVVVASLPSSSGESGEKDRVLIVSRHQPLPAVLSFRVAL